jgi:hypothetical protein
MKNDNKEKEEKEENGQKEKEEKENNKETEENKEKENKEKEDEENNNGVYVPTAQYSAEVVNGSIIFEGYYGDADYEEECNMIEIAHHPLCRLSQEYFQFEEKDNGLLNYSVSINAFGDKPEALIGMIGEMLWALYREGDVSSEDVVHINMSNDFFISDFEKIGFRKLATCIKEFSEERLQRNAIEGEDRMAARVGDLLGVLLDTGISLPVYQRKRPRIN